MFNIPGILFIKKKNVPGILDNMTDFWQFFSSEIQLKSPNWLFGQRKYEENGSAPKGASREIPNGGSEDGKRVDGLHDLNWLSCASNSNEEDIFLRYIQKCYFFFD